MLISAAAKPCGECPQKAGCTSERYKYRPFTSTNRPDNVQGVSEHARVRSGTTAKKESGSLVCGTQESDRAATLALTAHEVRSRVVLPGRGPEHQATRALPQPTNRTANCHHLRKRKTTYNTTQARTKSVQSESFSASTGVSNQSPAR